MRGGDRRILGRWGAAEPVTRAGVTLTSLIREDALDAELAALLWLLVEGGVPLVVSGPAARERRADVARAVLDLDRREPWFLLEADEQPLEPGHLGAILRGGVRLGISAAAADLRDLVTRLAAPPSGLSEDAVRRLGVVVVLEPRMVRGAADADAAEDSPAGVRVTAAHYLRPTERDGAGHVQRRPPAVLAARADAEGPLEHYAWGILPELADRVDRSQADLEARQAGRAGLLSALAGAGVLEPDAIGPAVREALEREPPREPAPPRPPARPSPTGEGGHRH